MVDGVLGEASVACEAFSSMPLFEIAVVQAVRIPAFDTVFAPLASLVSLDGDPGTDLELIHARSQRGNGARILVAHDELTGRLSLERAVQDFDVGSADRGSFHFQKNFAWARLRHRPLLHTHIIGVMEHYCSHRLGIRHGTSSSGLCFLSPNTLAMICGSVLFVLKERNEPPARRHPWLVLQARHDLTTDPTSPGPGSR